LLSIGTKTKKDEVNLKDAFHKNQNQETTNYCSDDEESRDEINEKDSPDFKGTELTKNKKKKKTGPK